MKEFEWIAEIKKAFPAPAQGLAIGDDAADFPAPPMGYKQVMSSDLLVEGVHFLKENISFKDLAYKALAVNVSDMSAMGAQAKFIMLSLVIPKDEKRSVRCRDFLDSLKNWTEKLGIRLIGGDTSSGPCWVIDLCIIGWVHRKKLLSRSGARMGDLLAVTGPLGDSALGCRLQSKDEPGHADRVFIRRHFQPPLRQAEAALLSSFRAVHAMMDLSDGLSRDAGHLLNGKSAKGVEIKIEALPRSNELQEYSLPDEEKINLCLHGGEDYELLLAVDPRRIDEVQKKFQHRFQRSLHVIGNFCEKSGIHYNKNNKVYEIKEKGYEHQ